MADKQTKKKEATTVTVPLVWVGLEEAPVRFVNQTMSTIHGDSFFVSLGTLLPPPILGTAEEQRRQAENLSSVPVQTVARFGLTHEGMKDLVNILTENLTTYEARLAKKKSGSQ